MAYPLLKRVFVLRDWRSKDGADVPRHIVVRLCALHKIALTIQDQFGGRKIWIISGWRSLAHNRRVGGTKNSFHMRGLAFDFKIDRVHPWNVRQALREMQRLGLIPKGGVGLYFTRRGRFVHYDSRGRNAGWRGTGTKDSEPYPTLRATTGSS